MKQFKGHLVAPLPGLDRERGHLYTLSGIQGAYRFLLEQQECFVLRTILDVHNLVCGEGMGLGGFEVSTRQPAVPIWRWRHHVAGEP